MNYKTKKAIPTSGRIVPPGAVLTPHVLGYYRLMMNGDNLMSFENHFVENTPEFFEPVIEWTDCDMIDFGLFVEHAVLIKRISKPMYDHFKAFIAYKGLKR